LGQGFVGLRVSGVKCCRSEVLSNGKKFESGFVQKDQKKRLGILRASINICREKPETPNNNHDLTHPDNSGGCISIGELT